MQIIRSDCVRNALNVKNMCSIQNCVPNYVPIRVLTYNFNCNDDSIVQIESMEVIDVKVVFINRATGLDWVVIKRSILIKEYLTFKGLICLLRSKRDSYRYCRQVCGLSDNWLGS